MTAMPRVVYIFTYIVEYAEQVRSCAAHGSFSKMSRGIVYYISLKLVVTAKNPFPFTAVHDHHSVDIYGGEDIPAVPVNRLRPGGLGKAKSVLHVSGENVSLFTDERLCEN